MMDEAGQYTREQWIWETYGLGILDARKEQPERRVDFIHRVWNTSMDRVMKFWDRYPDPFYASFKYSRARLYSTPDPPFADDHIRAMEKYGLKSWWNLRNDDIFIHRWGDPDYVREYIAGFNREHTAGFYMGSDGYVWGREFIGKRPELSGKLEFDKHWYSYMLWGRLAYQNDLNKDFFVAKLRERFPTVNAELLYSCWQASSRIIPQVNCFHWRNWDYQWAVEACFNVREGFHTVLDFIGNPTLEGSHLLNPESYAEAIKAKEEISGITPYTVADRLRREADKAIRGAKKLRDPSNTPELDELLDDITGMAWLGRYYADKIEAATELTLYQSNQEQKHKERAVSLLKNSVSAWSEYTRICEKNYRPQMLARTRRLDWSEILRDVEKDVTLAESMGHTVQGNEIVNPLVQ
jgi:hypothetical protein